MVVVLGLFQGKTDCIILNIRKSNHTIKCTCRYRQIQNCAILLVLKVVQVDFSYCLDYIDASSHTQVTDYIKPKQKSLHSFSYTVMYLFLIQTFPYSIYV